jgi:hypothetical protein
MKKCSLMLRSIFYFFFTLSIVIVTLKNLKYYLQTICQKKYSYLYLTNIHKFDRILLKAKILKNRYICQKFGKTVETNNTITLIP